MNNMQELNKQFQAAFRANDPSMFSKLGDICSFLESEGSTKVLAKALSFRSSLLDFAGMHPEARDAYIKALEVLFKAGFSGFFLHGKSRIAMTASDIRTIANIEAMHGAHDFVIGIDCDIPMFSWASAAIETMKTFFKTGASGLKASYKFLFLGKEKDETGFSTSIDTNFARLQIVKLPLIGKHSITTLCSAGYLDKLNWLGFRKTVILIINDSDMTEASMKNIDAKQFIGRLKTMLIKVHVISCGKFMTEESRQAIKLFTDLAGGLLVHVDEPGEISKMLLALIAGDLGQPVNGDALDLSNELLEKEANVLWQCN